MIITGLLFVLVYTSYLQLILDWYENDRISIPLFVISISALLALSLTFA